MVNTTEIGRVPTGLTSAEAAERLRRDGPNELVSDRGRARRWRRLLRPFADPMVVLLAVAGPTYLAIGDRFDAAITFVAIVPIAMVGLVLEGRAERTLERLRCLTAPTALVHRDERDVTVPAADVVVGDLVVVREGDVVPADASVVDATQVLVDESTLTGESLPVAKAPASSARADDERTSMVWAGTTVVSGRALAEVTATGARTRYGLIGTLVADTSESSSPLQRSVRRLVWVAAAVAAGFVVAVTVVQLARGEGWGRAVIAGVSLAIAALPEEFPMVYTLYLGLGAWRLARANALVRRLAAVETLGSTTVICTDKTGTLTEGRLRVGAVVPVDGSTERDVIAAAVMASEPQPFDPLEAALVDHAAARGVDVAALHASTLVADYPFDPDGKYVTHVWHRRDCDGEPFRIAAKGALEGLVVRAASPTVTREIERANAHLADGGMRVLAVAAGETMGPVGERAIDEAQLRLVGLVAFVDPLRAGVPDALAACRAAGVRVVMITGDHPATAHAVVEALDLPHGDADGNEHIATGADIDVAGDDGLDELVETTNVFARTRPEQKHRLVAALRRRGEIVAMTGDGINDAPALREADIGVAMGERGTAVAREAATLVLLDDNFATIVAAVRDGRRIFDQLQRAFACLVAFHPPLLVAALVVPLLGHPLLLMPVHLVTFELLLHPVVSLVFSTDPPARDLMQRPPRPPGVGLVGRWLWRPLLVGVTLSCGVVGLYLVALHHLPTTQARAVTFVALLFGQLVVVLAERTPHRALWRAGATPVTPTVAVIAAITVAFAIAAVYVAPLARVLRLDVFPARWWPVALGVAVVGAGWSELVKGRPVGDGGRISS